jgi:hypothetical protein
MSSEVSVSDEVVVELKKGPEVPADADSQGGVGRVVLPTGLIKTQE